MKWQDHISAKYYELNRLYLEEFHKKLLRKYLYHNYKVIMFMIHTSKTLFKYEQQLFDKVKFDQLLTWQEIRNTKHLGL